MSNRPFRVFDGELYGLDTDNLGSFDEVVGAGTLLVSFVRVTEGFGRGLSQMLQMLSSAGLWSVQTSQIHVSWFWSCSLSSIEDSS